MILGSEAIYQKDHYNLAIDLIDEKQIFIDNEIKRMNADELKNRWSYSLQMFNPIFDTEGRITFFLQIQ